MNKYTVNQQPKQLWGKLYCILFTLLLAACDSHHNISSHRVNLAIRSIALPNQFSVYSLDILTISLINRKGDKVDVSLNINKADFSSMKITLHGITSVPWDNYTAIEVLLDMSKLSIIPIIKSEEDNMIHMIDSDMRFIPEERQQFYVSAPLKGRLFKSNKNYDLNLTMDIMSSMQLIHQDEDKEVFFFTPILEAELSNASRLKLEDVPIKIDNNKLQIDNQKQNYGLITNDQTAWKIVNKETDESEALSYILNNHVTADLIGTLKDKNNLTVSSVYLEHSEDLFHAKVKGSLIQKNDNWVVFGEKMVSGQPFYSAEHRIFIDDTTIIQPNFNDSNKEQWSYYDLVVGHYVEALLDENLRAISLKVMLSDALVSVESVDEANREVMAKLWLLDKYNGQKIVKDSVVISGLNPSYFPQKGDVISLKGYISPFDKHFLALEAMPVSLEHIMLKIIVDKTEAQQLFTLQTSKGLNLKFAKSMLEGAIIEVVTEQEPLKIAVDLEEIVFAQEGNFEIQATDDGVITSERYYQSDKMMESLSEAIERNSIVQMVFKGRLENKTIIANDIVFSFKENTDEEVNDTANNTITHLQSDKPLPNNVKNGLIVSGVAAGVIGLYGVGYIAANTFHKPLLSGLFQRIFLPGTFIDRDSIVPTRWSLDNRIRIPWGKTDEKKIEAAIYNPGYTPNKTQQYTSVEPVPDPDSVIVYFGGNAQDNMMHQENLQYISDETVCRVVTMNYPGYGLSEGARSFENSLEASRNLINYLKKTYGYKNIIPMGWSYGGAIATAMAKEYESPVLLLNSTFSSAKEVANSLTGGVLKPIVAFATYDDQLNSAKTLKSIEHPMDVLLSHGRMDEIIDITHGKRLEDAMKNNKNIKSQVFFTDGDHVDTISDSRASHFRKFIGDIKRLKSP